MIESIKNLIKSKKTTNFIFASFNQLANQVIFLLTIPYLTRVIGMEKFGVCMSAISLANYFLVIVDYGFYYTITKEIAINENNADSISKHFSNVFCIKLCLIAISFFVYTIILFSSANYKEFIPVFYWSLGIVIGNLLIPSWLFQGLELFGPLALFNFISRGIFAIGIIYLVKSPDDYLYVNMLFTVGTWISGLICFIYIIKKFNIKYYRPKWQELESEIKNGFGYVTNNIIYSVYSSSGTIILGYTSTMANVGYFSTAEKFLLAIRQFLNILGQVLYPHLCKIYPQKKLWNEFYKKYIKFTLSAGLILCALMILLSNQIIYVIAGNNSSKSSVLCLQIFSLIPIILIINTIKYNVLVFENKIKIFTSLFIGVFILNIPMTILFTEKLESVGAAISLLITEIIIGIIIHLLSKKHLYKS
ncbi:MAG: oligosaccharide flippase family protein [Cytophagales bacterium]|nr:oligosaccharide flippase family protein [Cytophagales bacterium]